MLHVEIATGVETIAHATGKTGQHGRCLYLATAATASGGCGTAAMGIE